MKKLSKDLSKSSKSEVDRIFKNLYTQYADSIKSFILSYVAVESVAEDLTQDVFTKIYERPDLYGDIKNWKAFLFKVAKNHTLDYLKHNSLNVSYITHVLKEFEKSHFCMDRQILEKEYFDFLDKCLEQLPVKSKLIFGLCRKEEHSYEEVARQLDISKNTVKYHMVYSMKKIRKEVESQFNISLKHLATWLTFLISFLIF